MGASVKFVLKKKWGLIFFAKLDTKGGSVLGISTAIKTALKVALYDFFEGPPAPLHSQLMKKVNHYNWTKQIDFSMGPSVKFVLAIIDSIPPPKKGVNFFPQNWTRRGKGGPRASCL